MRKLQKEWSQAGVSASRTTDTDVFKKGTTGVAFLISSHS